MTVKRRNLPIAATALLVVLSIFIASRTAIGEEEVTDKRIAVYIDATNAFLKANYLSEVVYQGEKTLFASILYRRIQRKFADHKVLRIHERRDLQGYWGRLEVVYDEVYYSPYRMGFSASLQFSCDDAFRTNYDHIEFSHVDCTPEEESDKGVANDCVDLFDLNLPDFLITP